jgi:hypothetical protein
MDVLGGDRVSDQARHASFVMGVGASAFAMHACVQVWPTDFRPDLRKFDVPTLVMHGAEDGILPIGATAARRPALVEPPGQEEEHLLAARVGPLQVVAEEEHRRAGRRGPQEVQGRGRDDEAVGLVPLRRPRTTPRVWTCAGSRALRCRRIGRSARLSEE